MPEQLVALSSHLVGAYECHFGSLGRDKTQAANWDHSIARSSRRRALELCARGEMPALS